MKKKSNVDLQSMIRVNLAGEYSAVRIYQAQLKVARRRGEDAQHIALLEHMLHQEKEHFRLFQKYAKLYQVKPSRLSCVWHSFSYALGYCTAMMGAPGAMLCTVAVEEEIAKHYEGQLKLLQNSYAHELYQDVARLQEEELAHREIALKHGAKRAPCRPVLYHLLKLSTRLGIFLSKMV